MKVIVYFSSTLYAVDILVQDELVFREVCDRVRFTELMETLVMPETYYIKSSVVSLSEHMSIGKLKNMSPVTVETLDNLSLKELTKVKKETLKKSFTSIYSYIALLLGIIIGIAIMKPLVITDVLTTHEERIKSAVSIMEFNNLYSEKSIDATALYAEVSALYNPYRIELFHVDVDSTVEVLFIHKSPALSLLTSDCLEAPILKRGATITVDDTTMYIYQLGGKLYDN